MYDVLVTTRIIRQSDACVAYLFFDYKNREAETGNHVVRSLLKQLLLPLDLIPPALEANMTIAVLVL